MGLSQVALPGGLLDTTLLGGLLFLSLIPQSPTNFFFIINHVYVNFCLSMLLVNPT